MKIALIIDAQIDFLCSDGKLYVPGSETIKPYINQYIQNINQNIHEYHSILFTLDTHSLDTWKFSSDSKDNLPMHCEKGI